MQISRNTGMNLPATRMNVMSVLRVRETLIVTVQSIILDTVHLLCRTFRKLVLVPSIGEWLSSY